MILTPESPNEPVELIAQLSPSAALLAEAVSLAIRIEPQLLRRMRIALFPGMEVDAEADLWFSAVVESQAASGIVFEAKAAGVLRKRLAEKTAMLEQSWTIIEELHRGISPAILAEERLAYLALSGRYAEMRSVLQSAIATMVSPRGKAIAGWAGRAIERFPEEARNSEEATMLAYGVTLRLDDSQLPDAALPAEMADWAAWLAPTEIGTVAIGVTLLEGAVEFGPPGRSRSHRIEIPRTRPLVLHLSWQDGTRRRLERVVLDPAEVRLVEVGPGITDFELQTALGDAWTLTVPAPRERESLQKKIGRVRPPRVHISYDLEIGDAIEKRELPFVVAVLADMGWSSDPSVPLAQRRLVQIDPDNFDSVLASIAPLLSFSCSMDDGDPDLTLSLRFASMEDFSPVKVARQVPPLAALVEKRARLVKLQPVFEQMQNLGAVAAAAKIGSPGGSIGTAPSSLEDVILFTAQATKAPHNMVKEIAAVYLENEEVFAGEQGWLVAANMCVKEIDAAVSRNLSRVMQHPQFLALEASWRGLKYLVDQTESSQSLKLELLNVTKDELREDLSNIGDIQDSALFRRLLLPFEVHGGEPFGALVGGYSFDQSSADAQLLEKIAQVAEGCNAPFLASAYAEESAFGFSSKDGVPDPDHIINSATQPAWQNLRKLERSRYLVLTLPRMLLRRPYSPEIFDAEEFQFEATFTPEEPQQLLWGSAAFALAARITDAFARYGWCAAIAGIESGGRVEGLATHMFPSPEDNRIQVAPVEFYIPSIIEKKLSTAGFTTLSAVKDADYGAFLSASTVYEPPEGAEASEAPYTQLAYMLVISRFAQYLRCMMRDRIDLSDEQQLARWLNSWIATYVLSDENAGVEARAARPLRDAQIELVSSSGSSRGRQLILSLAPHFQLDPTPSSLSLALDIDDASLMYSTK